VRGAIRAVTAAGLAAVLASACSSAGPGRPAPSLSASGRPAAGASGRPAGRSATARRLLACLAPDTGGIADRSFNAAAWQGLRAARAAQPGITIAYRPSAAGSDYPASIGTLIRRRCGIIVTVGLLMAAATRAAALAHPRQRFAIADYAYRRPVRNIDALAFDTAQSAFLGGYLAAGMSKTGVVGTFGGQQLAPVTRYLDGFADGVRYYDTRNHARVRLAGWSEQAQRGLFIDTFRGQGSGRAAAQALIGAGADVIFPVAGAAGADAARVVAAADAGRRRPKILLEWPDTSGCTALPRYCRYILASVTKSIALEVKSAVLAAAAGRSRGGTQVGTLANGGVALTVSGGAGRLPASMPAALARIREQIASGAIVPATKSRL
jgi:basic membrane protein A and related proteins